MTKAGEVTEEDGMGEPGLIENPDRAALEAKLTEAEDKALRAVAEMQNIQRRADQRVAETYKYAVSKLLEELIPVLDSLEQSLMVEKSEHDVVNNMRDGMALTLQMLLKILDKFGVKEINPDINTELFNPALHEVMIAQEKSDVAPNSIIAVMQKGYQLHDRLIRPARVMIAKAA